MKSSLSCKILALASSGALWFSFCSKADAVILLGTGDPTANTTAPTGDLANSGWQYEGIFGGFLATPIAPNFFITAAHIGGGVGQTFTYGGVNYTTQQAYNDPFSDFIIWRVNGPFPTYALLYTSGGEVGQRMVVIGRGTQRGAEVIKNGTSRGWLWGNGDGVQRWGENYVTSTPSLGPVNQFVYATFDASGSPNEGHLSSGDSGGAVFVQDAGVWKLAGINYSVDGPLFTDNSGGGAFTAALFDARGYYYQDAQNPALYDLITGARNVPTGLYASRIASKLPWIYSVIDPNGDADGNGVSNLVEYALSLNTPDPTGLGAPTMVKDPGFLSIVYRKIVDATAPHYTVQKSSDLRTWTTVTANETLVSQSGNVHTVKAQVPSTGNRTFLRVLISP
ncbi:MAG: hypothetical protein ACR2F0_08935 [Chthoniobacterales bacterium]